MRNQRLRGSGRGIRRLRIEIDAQDHAGPGRGASVRDQDAGGPGRAEFQVIEEHNTGWHVEQSPGADHLLVDVGIGLGILVIEGHAAVDLEHLAGVRWGVRGVDVLLVHGGEPVGSREESVPRDSGGALLFAVYGEDCGPHKALRGVACGHQQVVRGGARARV